MLQKSQDLFFQISALVSLISIHFSKISTESGNEMIVKLRSLHMNFKRYLLIQIIGEERKL